jgi:hypothetical protein
MTKELESKLLAKYGSEIEEMQKLMGCKFEKLEENPKSKRDCEQYAYFSHPALIQPKRFELTRLIDKIAGFKKQGFNVFTANTKANADNLKDKTNSNQIKQVAVSCDDKLI